MTFEQKDGTCAGLICPECAAMAPFHTLENERAIPITCEVDGLRCCNVCDIEFRDYQNAQDVLDQMDRVQEKDMGGLIELMGKLIVAISFVAIVIFTLFAFFNLL